MMHKWQMDEQKGSRGGYKKHSADPCYLPLIKSQISAAV